MRCYPLFIAFVLVGALALGCSDDTQTPHDATPSDGPISADLLVDAPSPHDGRLDGGSVDLPHTDLVVVDGPALDQALVDTSSAYDGPIPDPGPVQCRDDNECAAFQSCNRQAPGGICIGCGTCLDPIEFECNTGACVRTCSVDSQCNAGMRCANTGYCVLRSCSAIEPCPAPYFCNSSGFCARPSCGPGASCPAPLSCDAALCVEP